LASTNIYPSLSRFSHRFGAWSQGESSKCAQGSWSRQLTVKGLLADNKEKE